jgi:hypothetical protein
MTDAGQAPTLFNRWVNRLAMQLLMLREIHNELRKLNNKNFQQEKSAG